ncbi:MAG: hypothetical protein JO270_22740 [Acidobacteriaceae bacterium]|nr:hypothetical protein [Acidobacteriaceae bacterium]
MCLFLWAGVNWHRSLQGIVRDFNPFPFGDYCRAPLFLDSYRKLDFRVLWIPHNEHRIVFPEIVFATDMLFAGGRRLLPLACSLLCYIGILVALARRMLSDKEISVFVRLAAVALAATIMGWKGNMFVLSDPFLLQWTLTQVSAILALTLLAGVPAGGNRFLAGSAAAAVIATYSSGNGMLLWPVLIGTGYLLGLRHKQIAALGVTGLFAIGLYFIGYNSPGHLNLRNFAVHPLYSIEFAGAYMSMPFGGMKAPRFGAYLGLAAIAVMIFFFVVVLRRKLMRSSLAVLLFGGYAFAVLTAVLTAAGRMDPADAHYGGAEAPRYITLPLVSWALFVSAAIWVSGKSGWRMCRPWAIIAVISMLLLLGFAKLRWWFQNSYTFFGEAQVATMAVESGVMDNNLLVVLFPAPQVVRDVARRLQADRLSVYHDGTADLLGKPLDKIGRITGSTAPGRLTYSFPVEHGLEVAGFLDRKSSGRIVMANESRQVVGFGRSFPEGFPGWIPIANPRGSRKWIGFANLTYTSRSISAFVITSAGLLRLGASVPVPSISAVNAKDIGNLIAGVTFCAEPPGLTDRVPLLNLSNVGNAPPPIFSTWQGSDALTATVESSAFTVPANRCLVLPVLTGPSTEHESVKLVDADTGQRVASAPMQDQSRAWAYWRMPIEPGMKRLRLLVRDDGAGWGQWIAVSAPRQCR